jgi:hypothetical protein
MVTSLVGYVRNQLTPTSQDTPATTVDMPTVAAIKAVDRNRMWLACEPGAGSGEQG